MLMGLWRFEAFDPLTRPRVRMLLFFATARPLFFFFSSPCTGIITTDGSSLCRQCYFDTPLYVENNPDEDVPEYPDCPCCVLEVYKLSEAANLNGTRCESSRAKGSALMMLQR